MEGIEDLMFPYCKNISDNMESSTEPYSQFLGVFTSFPNVTVDKWKYWLPEIWSSFLTQLAQVATLSAVNRRTPRFDPKLTKLIIPRSTQPGGRKHADQEPQLKLFCFCVVIDQQIFPLSLKCKCH